MNQDVAVAREGLSRVRGERLSQPDWTKTDSIQELPISIIKPDPDNPRTSMSASGLRNMVESMRQGGIIQPLKIRRGDDGEPIAIGGHRRLMAAQEAGLRTVPCLVVVKQLSEVERQRELLLDNMHREDLSPIDKARAYERLMKAANWTQTELAAQLYITPGEVSQFLSLLKLPEGVQRHVNSGAITKSDALKLTKLDPVEAEKFAARLIAGTLNGAVLADLVAPRGRKTGGALRPNSASGGRVNLGLDKIFHVRGGMIVTVKSPMRKTNRDVIDALEAALREAKGLK